MADHNSNISYYNSLKSMHRCVRCQGQDARTLIGKPLCFDCLELKRNEMKDRDQSLSNKNAYDKALSNGVCTRCKKRKSDLGYKTCKWCRDKTKKYRDIKKLSQGTISNSEAKSDNICGICYKNPKLPGLNTCEVCYPMIVERFKGTQSVNRIGNRISKEINIKEMFTNASG